MCLAVPGRIVSIEGDDPLTKTARVSFSGVIKKAALAYVPDALPGDFVLVHAGFALQKVDEEEARMALDDLAQIAQLAEAGAE